MKITILASGNVRSNFTYRVLAFARSLAKQGHEVSIIAPKADKYNDFVPENIDSIDGVRIWQPFQFATRRLEINLLPYMAGAAWRVLREKPDLVYIYKPTPASIVGLTAKLFRGTQAILDMDDLGSEVMKVEGHPWHQRKLVEWCERLAAFYADRIVAATDNLKAHYLAQFPHKPIHVMTNGVDAEWFSPPVPSKSSHHIVFMGAVNRKNILEPLFDVLPKIAERYPDAKATIIGDGAFLPYFREKCAALGISDRVEFTGWLRLEDARLRLFEGDIGYNYMPDTPTTRAVNNMKVPQYMSRGVVPIVSGIGTMSEVIEGGAAGYVCRPDDPEAFRSALSEALEDPQRSAKAKAAMAAARRKFNWDTLAAGFLAWMDAGSRPAGNKIFVVSTTVPADVGGAEIRIYNLVKQLVKRGLGEVEIFCLTPAGDPAAESLRIGSDVKAACHAFRVQRGNIFAAIKSVVLDQVPPFLNDFRSSVLGHAFRKACEESLPAAVHIEQMHGYYAIREHIPWLKSRGVRIILDCHNVEYYAFKESFSLSSFLTKIAGNSMLGNLRVLEIEAVKAADEVIACSERDAVFFRKYSPHVSVVPNGVDCSAFAPHPARSPSALIFMGGIGYPPNADGLKFYLQDIHPAVRRLLPESHLSAIGADRKWLDAVRPDDGSVSALGFVDDVRPHLEKASIGICPIRHGSGTRIKIMTYMAAGLPVVSTKKGAEGVGYTHGRDILITDDPSEFAAAIAKLALDKDYYERIAAAGHSFIRAHFDWDVIGESLDPLYKK